MSTLLQIAQLGNPILRQKARRVENVEDPEIQALIQDMLATCEDFDGVGISAPQVYRSLQIFIMASKPNSRYPNAPLMQRTIIINPIIKPPIGDLGKEWEGCLSIPGLRGWVPRPTSVTTSFTDRNGKAIERTFEGFLARIFYHEYDHLQGILFVDRASPHEIATEKEYLRLTREPTTPTPSEPKPASLTESTPICQSCGQMTERRGACYICRNCGESYGCS